jgi:hypothetical protein
VHALYSDSKHLLPLSRDGGFLVVLPPPHLLEQALFEHQLFERLERWLDVIVAHVDLHGSIQLPGGREYRRTRGSTSGLPRPSHASMTQDAVSFSEAFVATRLAWSLISTRWIPSCYGSLVAGAFQVDDFSWSRRHVTRSSISSERDPFDIKDKA